MPDEILTAMVSPNPPGVTTCTRDGTPYRTDADGLVYVAATHVTEMLGYSYAAAALTQVPPGDPLQDDTGWGLPN